MNKYGKNVHQVTEETKHEAVLERARDIFRERMAVRGDLWATSDVGGQLFMIFEKQRRVDAIMTNIGEQLREPGPAPIDHLKREAVDDLLDIINFAVFAVRHLEGDLP